METIRPYALPPELQRAPPRPARLPHGTQGLMLLAGLLLALLIAGGARVGYETVKMAHLNAAGQTVSARIVSVEALPAAGQKQAPVTEIRYQYTWPFGVGGQRTGVGQSLRGPFHVADVLPVRCGVWGGQEMVAAGGRVPVSKIVFLAACACALVGIGAGLGRRLVQWRAHRLHLLRHGTAAVGTLVHKRAEAHDMPRYFLRFGYEAAGAAYEREEQVTADVWKRAEIGQPVTVLFDPARPAEGALHSV